MFRIATTRLVLASFLGAGCVPLHSTVREGRSGRVVEADTGKPIANATVVVESYQVPTPPGHGGATLLYTFEAKTDVRGTWEVPAERDWRIGILAADGLPLFVDVYCIFANGYPPAVRQRDKRWLKVPVTALHDERSEHPMPVTLELARGSDAPFRREERASPLSRCGVPR